MAIPPNPPSESKFPPPERARSVTSPLRVSPELLAQIKKRWQDQSSQSRARAASSPGPLNWDAVYMDLYSDDPKKFQKLVAFARGKVHFGPIDLVLGQVKAASVLMKTDPLCNSVKEALKKCLNARSLDRIFPDIEPAESLQLLKNVTEKIRQAVEDMAN